jgi:hypothetical protein
MTNLDKGQTAHRSHLFTVRLWAEELGNGQIEWRGQIQHVLSSQMRYFRNGATLVDLVLAILPGLEGNEASAKVD